MRRIVADGQGLTGMSANAISGLIGTTDANIVVDSIGHSLDAVIGQCLIGSGFAYDSGGFVGRAVVRFPAVKLAVGQRLFLSVAIHVIHPNKL